MLKQQLFAALFNSFFLCIFLAGSVLNVVEGDYVQAIGFALLGIANIPGLLRIWTDRADTHPAPRVAEVVALIGLVLVVIRWLGIV